MTGDTAIRRAWSTWLLFGGLAAVFVGRRAFSGESSVGLALMLAGATAALATAVWQWLAWKQASGDWRRTEAVFAFAFTGCVVALACYLLGSEDGTTWLGLEFDSFRTGLRFRRFFLVSGTVLLASSAMTAAAAYWALRKGGSPGALHVDSQRVRETATNALTVALAGSAMMLLGYVAAARNQTADFSFFKTATPGTAVQEIVRNLDQPVRAALFFPSVNPVKDEVRTYLEDLARTTGRVSIEEYDRLADPTAAAEYSARRDGDLFLRVGERIEHISFETELDEARSRLRTLDSHVQQTLLMLAREERVAYLTLGHGEITAPLDIYAGAEEEERPPWLTGEPWRPGMDMDIEDAPPAEALRQMLGFLNYEVRDLGLSEGLGDRVPDDAAMVMILGPQSPFLDVEANAIQEYLDRGGSLLLALEPDSEFRLADFRDRLGVDFDPAVMIDDQRHLREQGTAADRRLIVTNRFSTHPAVTTASRQGASSGALMIGPGVITRADDVPELRTDMIISSLYSSFADRNGNLRFDEESEERGSFGLAFAVESAPAQPVQPDDEGAPGADSAAAVAGGGASGPTMRALVYADAEIFEDRVLTALAMNASLAVDGIKWLGREEQFAGEVVSEEDVPLVHTRSENVAWFYAIIFGAPTMVLALGVIMLYGQRRSRSPGSPTRLMPATEPAAPPDAQ